MIIGLSGRNGAGKGAVVEYLVRKGFIHYSVSGEITEEIKRRGLPIDRVHMRLVGDDMRKQHGADYFTELFFSHAQKDGASLVLIEALRHSKEALNLKKHGGVLVAVDADRMLRYERAVKRGSSKDQVSFEEFCMQEDVEMSSQEEHEMDAANVIKMADYTLTNNGTLEELHAQVDEVLKHIKK